MSRPLRIEYPGAWYHVMNRGRRSEQIFVDEGDYLEFIELLIKSSKLWSVNIYAFSLMPNHYHLLINTPLGNLSRFMRHIDGVYTQNFNKAHKYEGALFKGRYKSILVEFDSYFMQLVRYIHRNPIRAKLVKNLDDYRWTSHHAYINKFPEWEWIKCELLLSMISDTNEQQISEYKKYIVDDENENLIKTLKGKKWPSFLGSDKFVSSMKKKYFIEKKDDEVPDSTILAPEVELIKKTVCEYYGIDRESLCQRKRQKYNEPRNVAIYLTRYLRNDTLQQISKEYFLGNNSSVSRIIRGINESILSDPEFENRVVELRRLSSMHQIKT